MSAIAKHPVQPSPVRKERGTDNHVVIEPATWKMYRALIDDLPETTLRITYSDGVLEIMSPLPKHERAKKIIGRMIEQLSLDLGIEIGCLGNTTYASDLAEKGLEPDECYYFANESKVRGKDRFDMAIDPPPDVALEMDISYRAIQRDVIYAALKVPEVWCYDGVKLECLVLEGDKYQAQEFSRSLPFLRVADLVPFVNRAPIIGENAMMREFREWLKTLKR